MPQLPPPFDVSRAREAYAAAADLHAEATRRSDGRLTEADLADLSAADHAMIAALEEGRLTDAIRADYAFHQRFIDRSDDPDLRVTAELLASRLRELDLWLVERKSHAITPGSHPAIVAALREGDSDRAADLVRDSFLTAAATFAAAAGGTRP